jgi:diadenosine tetraphosphate (Ap4A) HIT family hydrolase
MKWLSKTWVLDPRLDKDTILISSDTHLQTRLMNDKRWPWIIVVPVIHDVEDIEHYQPGGYNGLMQHLADISLALKEMHVCTSTNVATLGNVVKQMHWHVVGRSEGDPNWPAPVWGFEKAIPYGKADTAAFISDFKKAFRGSFF